MTQNENKNLTIFARAARLSLLLAGLSLAAFAPVMAEEKSSLHGQPWAFGQSAANRDVLWHQGINAETISKNATPPKLLRKGVDTSSAIHRALNNAEKRKPRGSVGMSMDNQASAWKVEPGAMRADEFRPRDTRHVVRAYADVKSGNGLDVKLGPELILRDQSKGIEAAHEDQPDSALGVGMRFKYDF